MSTAYYIALDNPAPGFDPFVNGKAIGKHATAVSRIAKSLGLPGVEELASFGELAAEFGVEGEGVPPTVWHPASTGLEWVRKLRAHLLANPKALKDSGRVNADLEEFEEVLEKAEAIGARFHFAIDF